MVSWPSHKSPTSRARRRRRQGLAPRSHGHNAMGFEYARASRIREVGAKRRALYGAASSAHNRACDGRSKAVERGPGTSTDLAQDFPQSLLSHTRLFNIDTAGRVRPPWNEGGVANSN